MKKLFAVSLLIVVLLNSCATIFTGTKDIISFNSNPQGAIVYIDGIEICKTPCEMPINRSVNDKYAEFKLDGYKVSVVKLDKEFNVVSVLNIAVGGLIGWAIDAATGSIMKYSKKSYDVKLDANTSFSQIDPNKIEINTQNKTISIFVAQN